MVLGRPHKVHCVLGLPGLLGLLLSAMGSENRVAKGLAQRDRWDSGLSGLLGLLGLVKEEIDRDRL